MIHSLESEIWLPITGYDDYEISNKGRVKSLSREKRNRQGKWIRKEVILKPGMNRLGYFMVSLYKDKKAKSKKLHRLIAEAFIPNPNNLPCVNHIDENKENNDIDNLEWCTYSYNLMYSGNCSKGGMANANNSKNVERFTKWNKENKGWLIGSNASKKPVLQILNGVIIMEYSSAKDANTITGINASHIGECCKGKAITAGGYNWAYK
jgi:hypothetical protein